MPPLLQAGFFVSFFGVCCRGSAGSRLSNHLGRSSVLHTYSGTIGLWDWATDRSELLLFFLWSLCKIVALRCRMPCGGRSALHIQLFFFIIFFQWLYWRRCQKWQL